MWRKKNENLSVTKAQNKSDFLRGVIKAYRAKCLHLKKLKKSGKKDAKSGIVFMKSSVLAKHHKNCAIINDQ